MSRALPSAALIRPDAAVALVPGPGAHVVEVAGDHVAVHVLCQAFQPLADLLHAGAAVAQAHGFHGRHALRGEQVLGVQHAQRERRVVARGLAHRFVVVEDREAGLHRVVVDRTAGLGDRHAEHVVVIDHQLAQEQIADLHHAEGNGLGLGTVFGHVGVQETQGGLFVAVVGQYGFANPDGDGQQHDVVLLDEVLRQITGRVDHDSDAHPVCPLQAGVRSKV